MPEDGEPVKAGLPVPGPGRDSKFKPEYCDQAKKLCLLGLTDGELAEFFGVCERTINYWKDRYPAFLQSTREGKTVADAEVAESLYRRATGEVTFVERVLKNGDNHQVVTLRQYIPGDVAAQRIWLLNRRPKNWRDKQDMELSGGLTIGRVVFKGLNDNGG